MHPERGHLSWSAVTPARNERGNLARLAEAMIAQRLAPRAWIVVDDASDDGTAELAATLARDHDWISAVGWTEGRASPLLGIASGACWERGAGGA